MQSFIMCNNITIVDHCIAKNQFDVRNCNSADCGDLRQADVVKNQLDVRNGSSTNCHVTVQPADSTNDVSLDSCNAKNQHIVRYGNSTDFHPLQNSDSYVEFRCSPSNKIQGNVIIKDSFIHVVKGPFCSKGSKDSDVEIPFCSKGSKDSDDEIPFCSKGSKDSDVEIPFCSKGSKDSDVEIPFCSKGSKDPDDEVSPNDSHMKSSPSTYCAEAISTHSKTPVEFLTILEEDLSHDIQTETSPPTPKIRRISKLAFKQEQGQEEESKSPCIFPDEEEAYNRDRCLSSSESSKHSSEKQNIKRDVLLTALDTTEQEDDDAFNCVPDVAMNCTVSNTPIDEDVKKELKDFETSAGLWNTSDMVSACTACSETDYYMDETLAATNHLSVFYGLENHNSSKMLGKCTHHNSSVSETHSKDKVQAEEQMKADELRKLKNREHAKNSRKRAKAEMQEINERHARLQKEYLYLKKETDEILQTFWEVNRWCLDHHPCRLESKPSRKSPTKGKKESRPTGVDKKSLLKEPGKSQNKLNIKKTKEDNNGLDLKQRSRLRNKGSNVKNESSKTLTSKIDKGRIDNNCLHISRSLFKKNQKDSKNEKWGFPVDPFVPPKTSQQSTNDLKINLKNADTGSRYGAKQRDKIIHKIEAEYVKPCSTDNPESNMKPSTSNLFKRPLLFTKGLEIIGKRLNTRNSYSASIPMLSPSKSASRKSTLTPSHSRPLLA